MCFAGQGRKPLQGKTHPDAGNFGPEVFENPIVKSLAAAQAGSIGREGEARAEHNVNVLGTHRGMDLWIRFLNAELAAAQGAWIADQMEGELISGKDEGIEEFPIGAELVQGPQVRFSGQGREHGDPGDLRMLLQPGGQKGRDPARADRGMGRIQLRQQAPGLLSLVLLAGRSGWNCHLRMPLWRGQYP